MARKWQAEDSRLYLGDNGICLCGEHLGMTAKYSGRDISGQRLHALSQVDADEGRKMSAQFQGFRCEQRGCGRVIAPATS